MTSGIRADVVDRLTREVIPGPSGGSAVAVLGIGGIGKSTLLASVADAAETRGVRVLRWRATELTLHEPFASVAALIEGHPSDMVSAALETVDEWCSEGPVLVWVDDAHHLDTASSRVLARMARVSRDLPLTVLISARTYPWSPDLERLVELCSLRIDLGPLTHDELTDLVKEELGGPPGPKLLDELAVAGGNPFAVGVLLDLLDYRGALIRDGRHVEIDVGRSAVPSSAAAAVRSLIAQFPQETCEILSVVAVLGCPTSPEDVSALSERPLVSLMATLAPAVDAGVLRWDEELLVFSHDLFPETLKEDLPEALRTALHRRAVGVLQARDAPARQVAEHAWRGGDAADVPLVRSVAAGLDVYAPGVAADLLSHIQPLIAAEETDEMVADRADSLIRAGRGIDAEDLISAYLPRATSRGQIGRLHRLALTSLAHRANTPAVHARIDNVLARLEGPSQAMLELIALRGWMLMLDGHLTAAADVASQLDDLEGQLEHVDGSSEVYRLPGEYHVAPLREALAWLHGRPHDALRMSADARAVDPARTADQHLVPVFPPLYVLYAQGPELAARANAEARAVSALGDFTYVGSLHDFVLGNIHFMSGRWDDAEAALDAGLEIGDETGSMGLAAPLGLRALMDVHRGRIPEARSRLDLVARKQFPPQMGRDFAALAAAMMAETEAVTSISQSGSRADWATAFEPVCAAARSLWSEAVGRGGELWMATIAGYVARMADDALLHAIVEELTTFSIGQMPVLDPVYDQVRGMNVGDHEAVAAAAHQFAQAGNRLAAGFAWEEAGFLAARSGASGAATQALRNAVVVYEELGAGSDQDRLRARAQRLGIKTSRPKSPRKAKAGWGALTPTEDTVADLVRDGLTNPEIACRLFLSPRTVQTHVSHILQKTNLRSRVEVAAARA